MTRVLITGSRNWRDRNAVRSAIADAQARYGDQLIIVHGACPTGADAMADDEARALGLQVEVHPADWDTCVDACYPDHRRPKPKGDVVHPGERPDYCPYAGPRRNAEMVATGAAECLAFIRTGSRGAAHTASIAEAARIPVRRWTA